MCYKNFFFVLDLDEPTIKQTPNNETYVEGSSLTLTCNAGGNPSPGYRWFKYTKDKKRVMVGETNEITFRNLSISDSGTYRCNVGNEATSKFVDKHLAVNCKSFGYHQKQPSEVFCKKGVLGNFAKFTGKHMCQSLFFNEVAGSRPATLLKGRPWHRCFPVNFAKISKNTFS